MHEASLMTALMAKIAALAAAENARRVMEVSVWLGALSHMSAEHFREHFEQAAAGTLAEGAALAIETSDDIHHPEAQQILLKSIEVDC